MKHDYDRMIIHPKDSSPMCLIQEGEFLMGTSPEQLKDLIKQDYKKEWFEDEIPQHVVYLDPYYIDVYPISNFQYSKFIRETGYKKPDYFRDYKFNHPLKPVVGVSWEDAFEYCNWANRRLPTEAEWEKASRGTDGRLYPWGNQYIKNIVNSHSADGGPNLRGQYFRGKSPYGAEDMSGNIWEWVNDYYSENYYKYSQYKNPQGPLVGDSRVVRGGSWINEASYLRCASRDVWREPRKELKFFGFRTAISANKVTPSNEVEIYSSKQNQNQKIIIGDYLINKPVFTEITKLKSEKIPLNIIHEDEDIIVLFKPAGMLVHPSEKTTSGTLVSALLAHTNNNLSTLGDYDKPGIVHRLDRYTSGVMVVAKNNVAFESLKAQWYDHSITKIYHAIVYGKIPHDQTFVLPIGKDDDEFDKQAVKFFYSKEAITHLTIVEKHKYFSLVQLKIDTGRTHQIRVHLSHVGHPIVGDQKYFESNLAFRRFNLSSNQKLAIIDLGQRQLLHARKLGFIHPTKREYVEFEAEYPDDFRKFLNLIK